MESQQNQHSDRSNGAASNGTNGHARTGATSFSNGSTHYGETDDGFGREARRAIEAMLLVASEPTEERLLAQVVELPADRVRELCLSLAASYEAEGRGFQLVEVAGGWRYQTHPDCHPYVERYALEGIPSRLSTAALETMAIVAYKQPISRAQISAIRGVNVDGVLKTLEQRGYVREVGRDPGPGQAVLFGTTDFFLEQLGLVGLPDLPPLGDFVPSVEVLEALEGTLLVDSEATKADKGSPGDRGDSGVDGGGVDSAAEADPAAEDDIEGGAARHQE